LKTNEKKKKEEKKKKTKKEEEEKEEKKKEEEEQEEGYVVRGSALLWKVGDRKFSVAKFRRLCPLVLLAKGGGGDVESWRMRNVR
jgi:hypothetical protein